MLMTPGGKCVRFFATQFRGNCTAVCQADHRLRMKQRKIAHDKICNYLNPCMMPPLVMGLAKYVNT